VVDRETRKRFSENINFQEAEMVGILLDYRTAILEAHATGGRVGPAQRIENQSLAGAA
jgi:hypothetical protein